MLNVQKGKMATAGMFVISLLLSRAVLLVNNII